ncbi:MAG: right-handed parallel beta-helix repeat-containing protein [Burkholderiales bacterium]|nr:right-handed parallel beta-helix repeat-containing protein [Opitutaceae bacterium]
MRPHLFVFLVSSFASVVALRAAPLVLHVAPDGQDSSSGRSPSAAFATLERARDEIRSLKTRAGHLPADGVVVELAGGAYLRTASFELTAADSGTAEAPVIYRSASPDQPARLLGGKTVPLSAFRPISNPAVRKRLAPEAAAHVVALKLSDAGLVSVAECPPVFDDAGGLFELFANGDRLPLSRWPNEGFATMKRVLVTGATRTPGIFEYADERPARWTENPHVWLKGQWRVGWEDPAIRVAKIDPAARTITFAAGIQNGIGYKYVTNPDGTRPGNGKEPWHALNLLEEIDRPGEWALDFASGVLFLWPPDGVRELTITQLAAPLISARDVAHVDLVGLDLGYSLGHGLVAENVDSLRFLGSRVHHVAGTAVVLNGRRSVVQSCDLHDLGGGGVLVSGGDSRTLVSSENQIRNNHIHHYGILRAQYSAAVDVGFGGASNHRGRRDAVGVHVSHNRIHDAPRDAILVSGQNHVFEFNEISACGFGSADTGSFYSWLDWTIQGVVIRHNFIYDTVGGVNPDDGATGFHVYGNIFAGPRTGVWIASGPDHVVENNIFIKDEGPVFGLDDRGSSRGYATNKHLIARRDAMKMDTPPWSERFPGLAARLADRPELPLRTRFERNLIVIPKGDPIQNKVSRAHRDNPEILIAADNWVTPTDPGFVNAAAGDFALLPTSEVFRRIPNFRPIPFEKIGLQPDAFRPTVRPRPTFKGTPPPPATQPDQDHNFGT